MKKALMVVAVLAFAIPAHAASIADLIDKYSQKYDVSSATMVQIVKCESYFDPTIQSIDTYNQDYPNWEVKKGDRELSFGLVQIHLPSHPEITKAEALDPDFSLNYLAYHLSLGQESMWTCARKEIK